MMRALCVGVAALALSTPVFAQSTGDGGGGRGTVTSITCNNGLSGGAISTSGFCTLDLTHINVWSGEQTTAAATTGTAGFNLTPGVAPTSPVNGDLWSTSAGLYVQINGGTIGPLAAGGGSGCSVAGTVNQIVVNNGSTGCNSSSATMTTGGVFIDPQNGALSAPAEMFTGTAITGGSGTTTEPLFLLQPSTATGSTTWQTAGGTLLGINAHTGISELFDFQVDGTSLLRLSPTTLTMTAGTISGVAITASGAVTGAGVVNGAANAFSWTGRGSITSKATNSIQVGATDSASPSAQTMSASGSRGGTDSNVAGANFTIESGLGTGNATGSSLVLSTPHAGSTGSTQQTATAQLTLGDGTVAINQIASDATHTDATICEDTTSHILYAGSGTAGICLGTSSLRFKDSVRYETPGLDAVMALRPIEYHIKPGYGDPRPLLYGLAAEDVAKVIPALAPKDAGGQPSSVDYIGLIPVLVQAIKDQQAEIAELKAENAALMQTRWSWTPSISEPILVFKAR